MKPPELGGVDVVCDGHHLLGPAGTLDAALSATFETPSRIVEVDERRFAIIDRH